jgi:integrase/recombinase XerD
MAPDNANPGTSSVQQLSFLAADGDEPTLIAPGNDTPVTPYTALSIARVWFRQYLIDNNRPDNTVESYTYDLVVLEHRISDKPLHRITETDIAMYLAEASNKVTRKRRLTSVKAFFRYLTTDLEVLKADPTEGFSPHPLEHRLPEILSPEEQEKLMTAALADEPWSGVAIWLMMRLGLGRTELLALKRDHIDRTAVGGPEVLIAYDSPGKHMKQRTLKADVEFADMYTIFLEEKDPQEVLFPYGPQAVNGMVDRVAAAAGIARKITPQLLRQTAAMDMARRGHTVNEMLALLGMANDARNRETVRMFIDAASDLNNADTESDEPTP